MKNIRRKKGEKNMQRLWLEHRSTKTKIGAIEKSPHPVAGVLFLMKNIDGWVVVGWLHCGWTRFVSTERKNLMATFIDAAGCWISYFNCMEIKITVLFVEPWESRSVAFIYDYYGGSRLQHICDGYRQRREGNLPWHTNEKKKSLPSIKK